MNRTIQYLALAIALSVAGCSSGSDSSTTDDSNINIVDDLTNVDGSTTGDDSNTDNSQATDDDSENNSAPIIDDMMKNGFPNDVAIGTERVFDVLNGVAIEEMAAAQQLLAQAAELGFELLSTSFDFEISNDVSLFACPGGGTTANSYQQTSGPASSSTNVADACVYGDIVVSGNFFASTSTGRGVNTGVFDNTTFVENFSLNRSESGDLTSMTSGTLRIRGRFDSGTFSEDKRVTGLIFTNNEANYSVGSAVISISDSTVPFSGFEDGININIEALVDDTINESLNANTDQLLPFTSGISDPNPTSGVINITGLNANWQIDADGGDADSVLITVTTMGTTTGFQVPRSLYPLRYTDSSRVSFEP